MLYNLVKAFMYLIVLGFIIIILLAGAGIIS